MQSSLICDIFAPNKQWAYLKSVEILVSFLFAKYKALNLGSNTRLKERRNFRATPRISAFSTELRAFSLQRIMIRFVSMRG